MPVDVDNVIVSFEDPTPGTSGEAMDFLGKLAAQDAAPVKPEKPAAPAPKTEKAPAAKVVEPELVDEPEPDELELDEPETDEPSEVATSEAEPPEGVTSEAEPEPGQLFAGKFRTQEELEQGYRASSGEAQRLAQHNRELQFQLQRSSQQQVAAATANPLPWDSLSAQQQAYFIDNGNRLGKDPSALYDADCIFYAHQAKEQAAQLEIHRSQAKQGFVQTVDSLPAEVRDETWRALGDSGIDWPGLFDAASPQTAHLVATKFAETTARLKTLEKENLRLKSGQKQIADDARHQAVKDTRQSIGRKKASGTMAASAPAVAMKPADKSSDKSGRSIIDDLLEYDRDSGNRFTVTHG